MSSFKIKEISIDEQRILNKVTNDNFGLKAATEWKDLIGPYTPRDTGALEDKAVVAPWTITYNPVGNPSKSYPLGYHYAPKVYYGEDLNFQKTHNPYATHHWDKAAEQAGKKTELYSRLNAYLRTK